MENQQSLNLIPADEQPSKLMESLNQNILDASGIELLVAVKKSDKCLNVVGVSEYIDSCMVKNKYGYTTNNNSIDVTLSPEHINDFCYRTRLEAFDVLKSLATQSGARNISKEYVSKVKQLANMNCPQPKRGIINRVIDAIRKKLFHEIDQLSVLDYNDKLNPEQNVRMLISKVLCNANMIMHEGTFGPATAIITNGKIASILTDSSGFIIKLNPNPNNVVGAIYPVGILHHLNVFVDPNMKWDDTEIYVYRRNKEDEPGILIGFKTTGTNLMTIAEKTMAPKMILNLDYVVTTIGLYPEKNYRRITVKNWKS